MSIVEELEEKLEAVREKATGELSEVADKVQEAFHKLVEDNGVADEVTEKVAGVLKVAADKLEVAADKVSGLFEGSTTLPQPLENGVTPPMTVTEHGSLAPGFNGSDEVGVDAPEVPRNDVPVAGTPTGSPMVRTGKGTAQDAPAEEAAPEGDQNADTPATDSKDADAPAKDAK